MLGLTYNFIWVNTDKFYILFPYKLSNSILAQSEVSLMKRQERVQKGNSLVFTSILTFLLFIILAGCGGGARSLYAPATYMPYQAMQPMQSLIKSFALNNDPIVDSDAFSVAMEENAFAAYSKPVTPTAGQIKTTSQDGFQTLYIQPEAGAYPILKAIEDAKKTIDIQVYMLTMNDIIQALVKAAQRKVTVRIILEKEPFNPGNPSNPIPINLVTYKKFKEAGVINNGVWIRWSNKAFFTYTHQKTMIIDNKLGFIMCMNLSGTAVTQNREYLIADTHPDILAEMKKVFELDWAQQVYQAPAQTPLVISPVNSRTQLENLLSSAKKTLYIGVEVMGDPGTEAIVVQKFKAGVDISLMLGHYKKIAYNLEVAKRMQDIGMKNIKFLGKPFLHGKLIIADNTAYLGSVNLTTNSMDKNREMGILLTDKNIVNALKKSFKTDFANNCDPMP